MAKTGNKEIWNGKAFRYRCILESCIIKVDNEWHNH